MSLTYRTSRGTSAALWTPRETVVIEFWNVRCARCPRALAEVRALAAGVAPLRAVALATSADDAEEFEMAREWALGEALATDEFGFMDFAQKEEAKRALEFATLPFTVVVQDGAVVASGDPLAPGSTIASAIRQIL